MPRNTLSINLTTNIKELRLIKKGTEHHFTELEVGKIYKLKEVSFPFFGSVHKYYYLWGVDRQVSMPGEWFEEPKKKYIIF